MSPKTEKAYLHWIPQFILFYGKRHPREMGETEVAAFLTHLATRRHVSASTQNQALSALLFLYRRILDRDLGSLDAVRAKRSRKVPVVLTRDEVRQVLRHLHRTTRLAATLLYGSGLRLTECLRLRVKDIDFEYGQMVVHDGKRRKARVTMLPQQLKAPLLRHLESVRRLHQRDLEAGYDIRTVQELLGHRSVKTTMIYTHVLNKGGMGVRSPADLL